MAYTFKSDNPSQLYFDASMVLHTEGNILAPRGKKIREIRPTVFEFTNPLNRVTFLKGRKINPFFQQAESLWILLGRADVEFLTRYNQNMANFSDNGVYFNAPYGERLRYWGKNSASGEIFNPLDQLHDAYRKLKADEHTRQAFATIGDPRYDNANYTLGGGKDIACNREITFKIRDGKLDISVWNRSNDADHGLFGANLPQFTTIQEMVASWLGIEVGTYTHISDSFHAYLEDYGYKVFGGICKAYNVSQSMIDNGRKPKKTIEHFTFDTEPRMSKVEPDEFDAMLTSCEYVADTLIHNDDNIINEEIAENIIHTVQQCPDDYFRNTLYAMVAYRAHRLGVPNVLFKALGMMTDSQWKLSGLYFLYNSYKDNEEFTELYEHYTEAQKAYIRGE
jgi:thymidylate synthase